MSAIITVAPGGEELVSSPAREDVESVGMPTVNVRAS
jgi:hypothetical protein